MFRLKLCCPRVLRCLLVQHNFSLAHSPVDYWGKTQDYIAAFTLQCAHFLLAVYKIVYVILPLKKLCILELFKKHFND